LPLASGSLNQSSVVVSTKQLPLASGSSNQSSVVVSTKQLPGPSGSSNQISDYSSTDTGEESHNSENDTDKPDGSETEDDDLPIYMEIGNETDDNDDNDDNDIIYDVPINKALIKKEDLKTFLRRWAIDNNVRQPLLFKLKEENPESDLPLDPRTLLQTPNRQLVFIEITGGA
jgi:hypothetical protein